MPLNIVRQDITKMPCEVIVNATDRHMTCDRGVAAAIFEAAGEGLIDYLQGTIQTGEVRVTPAFKLPCKYLFHVAGPVWQGGAHKEKELLALCYKNVLKIAAELGAASIAIPLISSGAYGFPKEYVLDIAVETIADFLMNEELDVYLIVYDKNSFSIGKELFGEITEYINDNYIEADEAARESTQNRPIQLDDERMAESYRAYSIRFPRADFPHKENEQEAAEAPAPHEGKQPSPSEEHKAEISQFDEDDLFDFFDEDEEVPFAENACMSLEEVPQYECLPRKSVPRQLIKQIEPYDESDIDLLLQNADDPFAKTLFKLIAARHMTEPDCYKKANVSRQTWHKIVSDESYRPSKTTVIAFAIALKLDLDETKHLLETVGFALSKSLKFDLIIEYCVTNEIYDIFKINDILYQFDQALLGV